MARVTVEDCLEKVENRFAPGPLGLQAGQAAFKGGPACDHQGENINLS